MYLVVTRSFPPELGGMQSLMWGLSKELSKNYLIKVFADYQDGHKEFDENVNFSIERVGGIKFLRKIRKAQLIDDVSKENQIQGIIADHWKSLELIKNNKKKYCLIHGKEINHLLGSRLNQRVLKVLNNVESLLKIKTPRLITVSRFDKRKNHEKVIMALRNLKQIYPEIVYICIGYGDEEENIKDLVKELDLEGQVMFFKDISEDLKNALVAKSNIFVMPSIIYKSSVEGFGIAYTEAAQLSIPSIGGKDGGASDAIDHGKTGLICDGNNLDDIYSSINSMFENKKYLEYGKNAKEFVTKFYWPNIIEQYKKILS